VHASNDSAWASNTVATGSLGWSTSEAGMRSEAALAGPQRGRMPERCGTNGPVRRRTMNLLRAVLGLAMRLDSLSDSTLEGETR
jgi:hypothetical protein